MRGLGCENFQAVCWSIKTNCAAYTYSPVSRQHPGTFRQPGLKGPGTLCLQTNKPTLCRAVSMIWFNNRPDLKQEKGA